MGHAHGLYLLCSITGHPCWALVDTGSTTSNVRPGVPGELTGMLGKLMLPVKVGNTETTHEFWLEGRVYTSPAVSTRRFTTSVSAALSVYDNSDLRGG